LTKPCTQESIVMLNDVSINWWGALVAAVTVNAFAGLWFTVVVGKAHPRPSAAIPTRHHPPGR
jgi:hypothetical protein